MSAARRRRLPTSGDALVLGALLLLFAGLSYGIARQSEPPPSPLGSDHRSSFAPDPGGWLGFYRLLEKRQDKVMRFQRRPKEWPDTAGVVITGPYSLGGATGQWSPIEARDALTWVSEGGVLIAFTDAADDLTDALGLRTSEKAPLKLFGLDAANKKETETGASDDAPKLRPRTFLAKPAGTPLTIQQPALFLQNVSDLKVPGEKRFSAAPADSVPLAGDKLPLVIAIPYGDGLILAIADAGIADNSHLAQADNARFIVQMAEAYASKDRPKIAFDEYHQGYREADTFWTAIGRPGQLAFWQLSGLFLLIAYSASRRFGLPRPLESASRVSSEYVASLADLYRRARATDAALEAVLRVFWRDLCRVTGMPPDASVEEVALRAAAQVPVSTEAERAALAGRITATIQECRAKIAPPETPVEDISSGKKKKKIKPKPAFSEAELLRLATAIETLRKELELGGHSPV